MRDLEKYSWHRGLYESFPWRKPDLIIDGGNGPQTLRWNLFHRWGIQVALHRWLQSDSDRALHDHSAGNISILLTGCYVEHFSHAWQPPGHPAHYRPRLRIPFLPYYRRGDQPHRVELRWGPLWSLWIRFKPWREWGFYCPKGWTHWKDYTNSRDQLDKHDEVSGTSGIGAGCG